MDFGIGKFRISNILNTEKKKTLFSNFLYLYFLTFANYLLPLITFPYLVRVLGPEKFGLVTFAQSFIGYFQILTDYGFGLSAVKEISIYRENKEKVSVIFNSVMIIKTFFLLISLIVMSVIVFLFQKFSQDWAIYYLTFGMVIGYVLFPAWFFQGIEKMKYITILNVLARLLYTVSIFFFIKQSSDYLYVPLLNSVSYIIIGFLSLFIVSKEFGVNFVVPSFKEIIHQLKEGWYIFISTVAISLYTISNPFILGLLTNNTFVGYYSGAEKIIRAVQGMLGPISQAVYPYVSKLTNDSREIGINFLRKLVLLMGSGSFILSLFIFILADPIVLILLGSQYTESVVVLRILALLPFLIALSNVFGIHTMLNLGYKKEFSNIIIIASIINVLLAFIFVPLFKHIGISFSVLASEVFVTLSMFLFLNRKGINIIGGKSV